MANLKKYNLKGEGKEEVSIEDRLLSTECNSQLLKDYIVALRANRRQWSASTQSRGEVSHSKRKPYAQKGTGNARQGFLGSPQFRGGGRVHAPRPKFNQHTRINRKEKRRAICALLSERIVEGRVRVLDDQTLEAPKTKTLAGFLKTLEIGTKRVLFLAVGGEVDTSCLAKSVRNLPRVDFAYVENINGYDLALSQEIVICDHAMAQVKEMLERS